MIGSIEIVVDDREARSEAVRLLREMVGVSLRVSRLAVGDYLIDGSLLIERKSLADFVLSIEYRRLLRQARPRYVRPR